MAKRGPNGRFVKSAKVKLTKVTISAPYKWAKVVTHQTDLSGSELEVFKIRMRNQYAGEFGVDPSRVEVK